MKSSNKNKSSFYVFHFLISNIYLFYILLVVSNLYNYLQYVI